MKVCILQLRYLWVLEICQNQLAPCKQSPSLAVILWLNHWHHTYTFKLASPFLSGVVIVVESRLLTDTSQYTREDSILILVKWHSWGFAPVGPTTTVHRTTSSSCHVYFIEDYVKHRKFIYLFNDNHENDVHYFFCLICLFVFHWINLFDWRTKI